MTIQDYYAAPSAAVVISWIEARRKQVAEDQRYLSALIRIATFRLIPKDMGSTLEPKDLWLLPDEKAKEVYVPTPEEMEEIHRKWDEYDKRKMTDGLTRNDKSSY